MSYGFSRTYWIRKQPFELEDVKALLFRGFTENEVIPWYIDGRCYITCAMCAYPVHLCLKDDKRCFERSEIINPLPSWVLPESEF